MRRWLSMRPMSRRDSEARNHWTSLVRADYLSSRTSFVVASRLSRRRLERSYSTSRCCRTLTVRRGSASSGRARQRGRSASPLIDLEEDRVARAVLVGMLRETERGR